MTTEYTMKNEETSVTTSSGAHTAKKIIFDVRQALQRLLQSGEESVIDFNCIPCKEEDEKLLRSFFGNGEVKATVQICGTCSIWETDIHGVWWVVHKNHVGAILAKSLHVTYVPNIIMAQHEDVEYSLHMLERKLKSQQVFS